MVRKEACTPEARHPHDDGERRRPRFVRDGCRKQGRGRGINPEGPGLARRPRRTCRPRARLQTQLATQLLLAAAAGEEAWAPWLDSLPTDFDAFAYLDCEDVDGWVQESATMGPARGPARGDARRAPRRLRAAGRLVFSEEGPAALCGASPTDFRLAYCRVLSRAVTVDGKGCIGLVPFYDFLNHGRLGSEANVELLTYGQAVRRAGDASGAEGSFLDLDDMLLVATADIETGAELLTGYADAGADADGFRVKLLLQYGICLPPA